MTPRNSPSRRSQRRIRFLCMLTLAWCVVPAHAAEGDRYLVVVSNENSGTLSVIEGSDQQHVTTLGVGKRPRGLQAGPDGTIFVALSGSLPAAPDLGMTLFPLAGASADGVGVVDFESRQLLRVITGVTGPEQLAIGTDGQTLYVASGDTGDAVVHDVASGRVITRIKVGGEPEGVAIRPDGAVVYVSSDQENQITAISTADNTLLATVKVGKRPGAIAFSPDGTRAFVSSEADGSVTMLDAQDHSIVQTVKLAGRMQQPMGIVVAPEGDRVFVTTGRGQSVIALDARRLEVLGVLQVGEWPCGIAVSPDGTRLFTANGPSDDISVIDADTLQEIRRIPVGDYPWGVVVVRDEAATAAAPPRQVFAFAPGARG